MFRRLFCSTSNRAGASTSVLSWAKRNFDKFSGCVYVSAQLGEGPLQFASRTYNSRSTSINHEESLKSTLEDVAVQVGDTNRQGDTTYGGSDIF